MSGSIHQHSLKSRLGLVSKIFSTALLSFTLVGISPLAGEDQLPAKNNQENLVLKSEDTIGEFPLVVAEMFDVKFNGQLKKTKLKDDDRFAYSIGVTLQNITNDVIPGPVRLVIVSTGVKGLRIVSEDGRLVETDEEYTEFFPAGKFFQKSYKTKARVLTFVSKTELSPEKMKSVDFNYRITREEGMSLEEIKLAKRGKETSDDKLWKTKDYSRAELAEAKNAQQRYNDFMFSEKFPHKNQLSHEIYGNGITEDKNGQLAIVFHVSRLGYENILPKQIEGMNVIIDTTAPFYAGPAGAVNQPVGKLVAEPDEVSSPLVVNSSTPRARQIRPVPIGSSIANVSASCYSGTLGFRGTSLVDGKKVIVTNNHVIGEENAAVVGEPINQPSSGDVKPQCTYPAADEIGQFRTLIPMTFSLFANNQVDAAMANTDETLTHSTSPDNIGYGYPDTIPINPVIGMNVMKYGRTSGFTKGTITALNSTEFVGYTVGTARFIGQIIIDPHGTTPTVSLGQPGDSGSLIVSEDLKQPVALLFAGGGTTTIGNPIKTVLKLLKVKIDGAPADFDPTDVKGSIGDFVFIDANSDGLQQATELGQSEVVVSLYQPGTDLKINTDDDVLVKSTTTDSNGKYKFKGLDDGIYYVKFVPPKNKSITAQRVGSSGTVNSDANPISGFTTAVSISSFSQTSDVDCGLVFYSNNFGRIGNFVWLDSKLNGRQDRDERGMSNVKVQLIDSNGEVLKNTTTNASGFYSFTNLPAGSYAVKFFAPTGLRFTSLNSADQFLDSDVDPLTGQTAVFTLGSNSVNYTIDCGLAP